MGSFDTGWETHSHSISRWDLRGKGPISIFPLDVTAVFQGSEFEIIWMQLLLGQVASKMEQVWDILKYRHSMIIPCLFQHVLWFIPQKVHWKIYALRKETGLLLWWKRDYTVTTTFWYCPYQCISGVILWKLEYLCPVKERSPFTAALTRMC